MSAFTFFSLNAEKKIQVVANTPYFLMVAGFQIFWIFCPAKTLKHDCFKSVYVQLCSLEVQLFPLLVHMYAFNHLSSNALLSLDSIFVS